MKVQTLVIISLPFQRLIRSHLMPTVLDALSSKAQVAIVTPFAHDPKFRERYERPSVKILAPPSEENLTWLARKLDSISSILRVRGYWYATRKEIPYYWATRHIQFGENGYDRKKGILHQLIIIH